MNVNLKLKKSSIEGNSGIATIIFFAGLLIFVIIPIFSFVFDKSLVSITSQDIMDELELSSRDIYFNIVKEELSDKNILLSDDILKNINNRLNKLIINPIIETIKVIEVNIINNEFILIEFIIKIELKPTLYRKSIIIPDSYDFIYRVEMPIDS